MRLIRNVLACSLVLAGVLSLAGCNSKVISELQSDVGDLNHQVNSLVAENTKLKNDYETASSALESANTKLAEVNSALEEANQRVSELESQGTTTSAIQQESSATEVQQESSEPEESKTSSVSSSSRNKTITFDGFKIVFDRENAYLTKVDNKYSDVNNKPVIAIPTTVTNNNSKTGGLNFFYIKCFGSAGTTLDDVFVLFDDGTKIFEDLRPGASISGTIYMLYDGAGTYYITFDNFAETKEVSFQFSA